MKQHSGHDRAHEDVKRLDDRLSRGLSVSIGLHVLLLIVTFAAPSLYPSTVNSLWGSPSGGGGISVAIVSEVGGIPLPQPEVVDETAAGNDSEGFFEDEPPPPAPPDETPEPVVEPELIPESPVPLEAAPPPPPPEPAEPEPEPDEPPAPTPPAPSVPEPDEAPPPDRPDNAVPFGDGGQVALPFGQPGDGDGTGLSAGDGVFGERYGTYVESIRNRISGNWIQGGIDARIRSAPRVYVTFDIGRDGEITNVEIQEGSGNSQVDRSARRAVVASNRLAPLPRDYRGPPVRVRFWFEFRR